MTAPPLTGKRRPWCMMLAAVASCLLLVACSSAGSSSRGASPLRSPARARCQLQGQGVMAAPDRRPGCTPGVWIADRDTSTAHVCGKGYNPRPGTNVSGPLKHEAEGLYGETSSVDRMVEADHYFPRWLGGATVLSNFWPEPDYPHAVGFDHNPKDKLEFAIFRLTCVQRTLSVARARGIFEGDWRAAFRMFVHAGAAGSAN